MTATDLDTLVRGLRALSSVFNPGCEACGEAADAIEWLRAEITALRVEREREHTFEELALLLEQGIRRCAIDIVIKTRNSLRWELQREADRAKEQAT